MFSGLLDLPVWGLVVITLLLTHITIVSVTIYLHRNQAHRSLELHPLASHFFRFWLWLTTGMITKEWVAVHRKHHQKVESEEDPHSPKVHGVLKILFGGVHYYRQAAADKQNLADYGHGTPSDWIERRLYSPLNALGVISMLAIDVCMFGLIAGSMIWLVQMIWIPFFAAGVINGVGHWGGYRNFNTPDTSTNIIPLGILIGGEELHNNHHAFASSAKFSSKTWEFDIGWLYIRIMQALGLAKVRKLAPKPLIDPANSHIDLDTLRAIVAHRFQILSNYGKNVIQPILKKARESGVNIKGIKRQKSLLMRDENLLDAKCKALINSVLKKSEQLEVVYNFKQKLQELWKKSAATQDQLVQSLQEWIQQAEQTGIKALQDFARTLRSYTFPQPQHSPA